MNPDEAFKIHVQQNCHDNQSNQNHCEESTVSRSAATNASDCARDAAHGDGHTQQESQTFIAEQVFRTVCAFLGFFTNTLNIAILGPSLIDLGALTSSTTSQISVVFMIRGVLFIVGSLLTGPLLDRVNIYLLMGMALVANGALYASVPWCTSLAAMLGVLSVPEFFNAATTMGSQLVCLNIWKKKSGPVIQMLNLMAFVGWMVGPLLVKPFLSKEGTASLNGTTDGTLYGNSGSTAMPGTPHNDSYLSLTIADKAFLTTISTWIVRNQSLTKTNVVYVFVIVSCSSFIVGLFMLVLFTFDIRHSGCWIASESRNYQARMSSESDAASPVVLSSSVASTNDGSIIPVANAATSRIIALSPNLRNSDECGSSVIRAADQSSVYRSQPCLSEQVASDDKKRFVWKVLVLNFFLNFFYGGIEIGYCGLVMTFAVDFLHWSKEDGTTVTALIEASSAVATLTAAFLFRCVKPQIFLSISVATVLISMILLSTLIHSNPVWLWLCTILLGAGYGTIVPSTYLWVGSFMDVDGRFSSAYWTGFGVGYTVVPVVMAYLFNDVHPMWFAYVTLICAVGLCGTYIGLCVVVSCHHRRNRRCSMSNVVLTSFVTNDPQTGV